MSNNGSFKIRGVITKIYPEVNISEKFSKREIILDISNGGKYPKSLKVEFANDNMALLEGFTADTEAEITFTVESRQSKKGDMWFTSARGTNIVSVGLNGGFRSEKKPACPPPAEDVPPASADELDDMPF